MGTPSGATPSRGMGKGFFLLLRNHESPISKTRKKPAAWKKCERPLCNTFAASATSSRRSSPRYFKLCAKISYQLQDPVRCRECGYRILYKKRTRRLIVFDGR